MKSFIVSARMSKEDKAHTQSDDRITWQINSEILYLKILWSMSWGEEARRKVQQEIKTKGKGEKGQGI